MDFRYETNDKTKEFHKKRIAFIIYNNIVEFIKNSESSYYEYYKNNGMSKEEFNAITRGYCLDDTIVFYKDNFIYDNQVIKEGLEYLNIIMKECKLEKAKVYFGVKVDPSFKVWDLDYYYGEVEREKEIKL